MKHKGVSKIAVNIRWHWLEQSLNSQEYNSSSQNHKHKIKD